MGSKAEPGNQRSTERSMKIIVLVKQVPNTTNVRIDPKTGNLIREGVESVINPEDRHAVEAALRVKDTQEAHVIVLSMGPPQAIETVCECLAMGADEGILLTDRAFSGADTWATSTTLGLAIRRIGEFDLILAGRQAVDGDTAQIGPQLAEFLGIPQLTYVRKLEVGPGAVIAERVLEGGCEHIEAPTPVLVTVLASLNETRHPTVSGLLQAVSDRASVEVWNAADIGAKSLDVGLLGSLTQVVRTFTPKEARNTQRLEGSPTALAAELIQALRERDIRLGE
jgi:electron transfer flavoprotein beta subunit